jgi:hypothetical protein
MVRVDRMSTMRFGGAASIAIGVLTATAAVTYFLLPAEQRVLVRGAELLPSMAGGSQLLNLEFIQLALVGLLGLAAVPALTRLAGREDDGLVRWAAVLAMLGYGVSAVSYLFTLGRLPGVAAAFAAGDASTRAALLPVWRSSLDLYGFFQFAAVGVWILVVAWFARRAGTGSGAFAVAGIALGIVHVAACAAIALALPTVLTASVATATVLAPIWYTWSGLEDRRAV